LNFNDKNGILNLYLTNDANNGILTIDFDNKTFSLAMDDFMDHTTKAFDKQYEELTDFGEYLFCKKYTYISHKLI